MAFSTLNQLRVLLNTDLGRTDASTEPWGSDDDCNRHIQTAIRKMWPTMGRLVTETVTIIANQIEYALTAIRDIERIEVIDSASIQTGKVSSWQLLVDESADPIVRRLLLPAIEAGYTLRVIGYQPYAVPASGAASCDLPTDKEHIAIVGARVEAYRRRFNEYVDYEQRGIQNPVTAIPPETLERFYFASKSEFEELLAAHRRDITAPRRARLTVR